MSNGAPDYNAGIRDARLDQLEKDMNKLSKQVEEIHDAITKYGGIALGFVLAGSLVGGGVGSLVVRVFG